VISDTLLFILYAAILLHPRNFKALNHAIKISIIRLFPWG